MTLFRVEICVTLFRVEMCDFVQGLDVRLCSGLRCVTLFMVEMCDFVQG